MPSPQPPTVAVIGLGYVGLTLGVALALRGIRVIGVERRPDVVELTRRGQPHFSEAKLAEALEEVVNSGRLVATETLDGHPPCDYYIITVGTPLHPDTKLPRRDMIEAATRQVAAQFTPGATVILRSTVQVGTTREIVKPILDASGKAYLLSMCPERTLEGDALRELSSLPQIVGGMTSAAADSSAGLFNRLTHTVVRVDDPETAEMIKLVDNTFRDVSFAFGNEVARACVAIGVNAHDVIRYGKLDYPRTNVAKPGPVGGPCLEKDPHILLRSLAPYNIDLEITRAARLINERQPAETVATVMDIARRRGCHFPLRVALLGMAFKGRPETDDLRGSMSLKILEALQATRHAQEIRAFDPVIAPAILAAGAPGTIACASIGEAVNGVDVIIIANNHPSFAQLSISGYLSLLAPNGFIYDYWNHFEGTPVENRRGAYFTVGHLPREASA